jgi:oxygen-independent coproporphyrinogen-3 oxidase
VKKKLGLYIHIPFCKKKCAYCDFYSICDNAYETAYISALCTQLRDYASAAKKYDVDSIYLGGGTPSLLSPKSIKWLFKSIKKNMKLTKDCEISAEINPESANKRILKAFKRAGVNRLSFGVQSADDAELATLSRLHSFSDFRKAYELARKLKFNNISVDLMYGFPGQTMESLLASIDAVAMLAPEHLSLYGLKLEEGTPLYEKQNDYIFPDEDAEADMYFAAIARLKIHGYEQYEISNLQSRGMPAAIT